MSEEVDPMAIEEIVGTKRTDQDHHGRYDERSGQFYILHSWDCRISTVDLRRCPYSQALDRMSTNIDDWWVLCQMSTPHLLSLDGRKISGEALSS